jgi:uncharacterized membrane protein
MTSEHWRQIEQELHRLNDIEQKVLGQFLRRQRTAYDPSKRVEPFGDRVADKVAAFGGSWTFIFMSVFMICAWMAVNALISKPFDAYPYIFLNLVLSCLAALQAPIIMMSQNRQAAHDRLDMVHDYEINTKAELEIVALHTKLDEIREQKWAELVKLQEEQLVLLTKLSPPQAQ